MSDRIKISLVIAAFNRAPQISHGLRSIFDQSEPPEEIIVIDDGSSDSTFAAVHAFRDRLPSSVKCHFRYYYVDFRDARISCFPRNLGARFSTHPHIAFAEAEVIHHGETFKQIRDRAEEVGDACIFACDIWSMGQKSWNLLLGNKYSSSQEILSHPYAMRVAGNMQNTNAPDSDWGISGSYSETGAFFMLPKTMFEACGGFDESLVGFGFDDFDLFGRLRLLGYNVYRDDSICIIHQWHEKNYPFNTHEASRLNGERHLANVAAGRLVANQEKEWGMPVPSAPLTSTSAPTSTSTSSCETSSLAGREPLEITNS
jgi:GT2 family glycosyltransferase